MMSSKLKTGGVLALIVVIGMSLVAWAQHRATQNRAEFVAEYGHDTFTPIKVGEEFSIKPGIQVRYGGVYDGLRLLTGPSHAVLVPISHDPKTRTGYGVVSLQYALGIKGIDLIIDQGTQETARYSIRRRP